MNNDALKTYKEARAAGKSQSDACRAVLSAYPDADFDDVVDMSWRVETGKPEPEWLDESGCETAASRAWSAGKEAAETGE